MSRMTTKPSQTSQKNKDEIRKINGGHGDFAQKVPRQALLAGAGSTVLLPISPTVYGSLEHIISVLARLDALYGFNSAPAGDFTTGEPLDGLILTVLSQNTNDKNRDMAYKNLRAHCPEWADASALSAEELADLVRSAGLGDTKAVRIKHILEKVPQDFGGYSLISMKDWTPEDVREYLTALPGIGPKTAACVMAFDLDMPAFPVDTHVARVSRRLGWASEKESAEKIQTFLEATVPHELCRGGHLNIIEHGRKTCSARKPDCTRCVLRDACRYAVLGSSS